MYCIRCGAVNRDGARFCVQCGAPLTQVVAAPQERRPVVERRRPSRWRHWLIIGGLTALLLALLCVAVLVAAYFWLGFNRSNQTAEMVSADTPILLSFSPDPRQAIHFRSAESAASALEVFGAVPGLRNLGEAFSDEFLQGLDVSFQEDILPWIGPEAGLAIMDMDAGSGDVAPIILTAATRNQDKSDAFLAKIRKGLEEEGATFAEETYNGVQIVYQVPDYEGELAPAFATVKGLVMIGSNLEAVHQAIATAGTKSTAKLVDEETYHRVMQRLPGNRLGYLYLSSESMLRDLEDVEASLGVGGVQAAGVSFGLASGGVRFDYAVSIDPKSLTTAQLKASEVAANRRQTADLLPNDTILYLSGQDLSGTWDTTFAASAQMQGIQETLDAIRSETGVDLADDVLARMTGEYALALLPDSSGLFGDDGMPFGLILIAQVVQPAELKTSLDTLAGSLAEGGEVALNQEEIGGTTFTLLQEPSGDMLALGYGVKDNLLIIGTSRKMLEAALKGKDQPLSSDETFRATVSQLPGGAAYLFVDVEKAVRLVYEAMDEYARADFDEEIRPYVESLRGIGLSAQALDKEGISQGTLYLYVEQQ